LAFSDEKPAGLGEEQLERERTRLHSKIGELSIQVDFLKKKCRQLGLPED
jgi:hypothetical protein